MPPTFDNHTHFPSLGIRIRFEDFMLTLISIPFISQLPEISTREKMLAQANTRRGARLCSLAPTVPSIVSTITSFATDSNSIE
jgi:hypothetical protein